MRTAHNLSTSSFKIKFIKLLNILKTPAKVLVFVVILPALVYFLEGLLQTGGSVVDRKRAIEQRPVNSIDVMFIGNSHAYCTFDLAVMEDIMGKRVFNAGLPDQKIDMNYFTLQEMLKTQNPETIVLEAFSFGRSDSAYAGFVANMDAMKPSLLKFQEAFEIFPDKYDAFRMSLGLFRSHNNWKKPEVMMDNLKYMLGSPIKDYTGFDGFYPLSSKMSAETIKKYWDATDIKFTPVVDEYLAGYFKRIVRLCKERNIRLVVAMAPFSDLYVQKVDYNSFYEKMNGLCRDEGVEYVDYNMLYKQIGLTYNDFEDAFHHAQHMNKGGAEKVSGYMAQYLKDTQ
jgi:hypothetical protein